MKTRLFILFLLLAGAPALNSCRSGGKPGDLPADVVSNPNTAAGNGDMSSLPVITFEKKEYDFGKIVEGESVSYEFRFTNTGKSDLVITDVSTSCGCTVPSYPKNAIRPGQEGTIKVVFNSRGKRGVQNKSIVVVANTQPNATQLTIKARVEAPGD